MSLFLNLLRYAIATLLPISAGVFSYLTQQQINQDQAHQDLETNTCLQCGQFRVGAFGYFFYTKNLGQPRQREVKKQHLKPTQEVIGSECHFICDQCAHSYLRNEIRTQILMAFCYPLFLFVVIPLFLRDGSFSFFLVEILLVILAIGGAVSAFDLFRITQQGDTPLAEVRDRLAIGQRKTSLGKSFSYFSRLSSRNLKESNGSSADR